MTVVRGGVLASAVVLLCAACSGDPGARSDVDVVDSAGVRIVTVGTQVDSGRHWAVDETPTVAIGAADGDPMHLFDRVQSVVTTAGGDIAVLMYTDVRVYDRNGTFLRAMGGEGKGPGELSFATSMYLLDDSLIVFDRSQRRVTVFATDGALVRTAQLEAAFRSPRLISIWPDGAILMGNDAHTIPQTGFGVSWTWLTVHSRDGAFLDSLPKYELQETGRIGMYGDVGTRLFGARTTIAGVSDGYWVARGEPQVERYNRDGRLNAMIRWNSGSHATTDADVAELVAALTADVSPADLSRMREFWESIPVAPQYPAVSRVLSADSDEIWVEQYSSDAATTPRIWRVFAHDGIPLGIVELPREFTLMEAGEEYVLGTWRGTDGVEEVRRYTLRRR